MSTYQVKSVGGMMTFEKPLKEILSELKPGGGIKILSPLEYHTDQQRKWYRGICLKGLSDWTGDTESEWDLRLKAQCGGTELLKQETIYMGVGSSCTRLTIRGVGKRNLTAYIENILSKSIEMQWPITPPDKELRK
jgi:hypothetical protein